MERMLSGIKPTGKLTLGNYIGAIQNFIKYQDEYELFIFIANLHAITVPQDKLELKKNTYDLAALYLACGLDPEKTTLFLQTDIPEHANLGFVLTCHTYMGELNRMTQYKDKVQKLEDQSIGVGLFTYPTLMAADILLYDPQYIPVGHDQKQHVELTRDLANRFNNRHGETFVVPQPLVAKTGARIMSLSNPTKKMSKSDDPNDKGCIYLLDDPKVARKKIMSAVTDTGMEIKYDVENKPGISNLMTIMACLGNMSIEEIEQKYVGCNYGTFKKDLADILENFLVDLQAKYRQICDEKIVNKILEEGAQKARRIAFKKLMKVYKKLGLTI
ncbi:MAG: tryptophan--tRNA ligase [Bacilli bacterium]|nr:tryptophan--tRNA ligase [Bacilli bacterium]